MSILLSDALKKVIAEHGIVVTHLSKTTGIDRTTLQHIIGGRRLPNKDQMNKLLLAISIPTHEKAILLQAYEFTTEGPDKFKQREKVKAIIEKIAFTSMGKSAGASESKDAVAEPSDVMPESASAMPVQNTVSNVCSNAYESKNLHDMSEISNALVNIIAEEECSVSFFMPSNFSFFYDTLFAKYTMSEELSVTCFFPISNETDNIVSDLEYCESFIPFFASLKRGFQAYYMRGQNAFYDASIVLFPYFVLTSRHVLLVSADMNHAILTKQDAFVRMYQKKCQDFLSIGSPLYSISPIEELMAFFHRNPTKDVFATLDSQPCLQYYLNEQIIKKYAIAPNKENSVLVQMYTKYINEMAKEPHLFSTFGQAGLDFFVETGYISVCPPSLGKPLNVQDRIKLLQRMLDDIKNDEFNCRMVDASKFTIPSRIVTIAVRRKTLFVQVLDYAGGNVKNICLMEKNVVEAFTDFLSNIQNTPLVHSKEETIKAFEVALEKLGAKS